MHFDVSGLMDKYLFYILLLRKNPYCFIELPEPDPMDVICHIIMKNPKQGYIGSYFFYNIAYPVLQ